MIILPSTVYCANGRRPPRLCSFRLSPEAAEPSLEPLAPRRAGAGPHIAAIIACPSGRATAFGGYPPVIFLFIADEGASFGGWTAKEVEGRAGELGGGEDDTRPAASSPFQRVPVFPCFVAARSGGSLRKGEGIPPAAIAIGLPGRGGIITDSIKWKFCMYSPKSVLPTRRFFVGGHRFLAAGGKGGCLSGERGV